MISALPPQERRKKRRRVVFSSENASNPKGIDAPGNDSNKTNALVGVYLGRCSHYAMAEFAVCVTEVDRTLSRFLGRGGWPEKFPRTPMEELVCLVGSGQDCSVKLHVDAVMALNSLKLGFQTIYRLEVSAIC